MFKKPGELAELGYMDLAASELAPDKHFENRSLNIESSDEKSPGSRSFKNFIAVARSPWLASISA